MYIYHIITTKALIKSQIVTQGFSEVTTFYKQTILQPKYWHLKKKHYEERNCHVFCYTFIIVFKIAFLYQKTIPTRKVFGVFLVCIWTENGNTPYLSVFSPNSENRDKKNSGYEHVSQSAFDSHFAHLQKTGHFSIKPVACVVFDNDCLKRSYGLNGTVDCIDKIVIYYVRVIKVLIIRKRIFLQRLSIDINWVIS